MAPIPRRRGHWCHRPFSGATPTCCDKLGFLSTGLELVVVLKGLGCTGNCCCVSGTKLKESSCCLRHSHFSRPDRLSYCTASRSTCVCVPLFLSFTSFHKKSREKEWVFCLWKSSQWYKYNESVCVCVCSFPDHWVMDEGCVLGFKNLCFFDQCSFLVT